MICERTGLAITQDPKAIDIVIKTVWRMKVGLRASRPLAVAIGR